MDEERRTTAEWLYLIGGHVHIGPFIYKKDGDGWLMGNRITEYDRHGKLTRDETVYNVRLSWS